MNGHGKSDSSVVPQKSPNKAGLTAAAEEAEGRGLAKGNPQQQNAFRTQRRSGAHSALEQVREVERNAPPRRHHLRQEPDAVIPLVRIRGGGRARARSLLRLPAIPSSRSGLNFNLTKPEISAKVADGDRAPCCSEVPDAIAQRTSAPASRAQRRDRRGQGLPFLSSLKMGQNTQGMTLFPETGRSLRGSIGADRLTTRPSTEFLTLLKIAFYFASDHSTT